MRLQHPIVAHTLSFGITSWLNVTGFGIAVLCAFFIAQYVCERRRGAATRVVPRVYAYSTSRR